MDARRVAPLPREGVDGTSAVCGVGSKRGPISMSHSVAEATQ